MTSMAIFKQQCHYCQKWHLRSETIDWAGGVKICGSCYALHGKRLEDLVSAPPEECGECRVKFFDLSGDAAGNVPMRLALKDGIYQLLCLPCADAYEQKVREQFKGTEYGANKLKI